MIRYIFRIVILFLVCLFVSFMSCESEQRPEITAEDLPDEISFYDHIVPIFEKKCIDCHNGSTPPNLTEDEAYIEISTGGYLNLDNPENSNFYKKINGGSMTGHASDLDRAYILKWIEQGALEN